MPLAELTDAERETIRECLVACTDGSFFPDWEFHSLFGIERRELRRVLDSWPQVDESDQTVVLAINNSLNNLIGYPTQDHDHEWSKFISADRDKVKRIFDKWRGTNTQSYFEGLR